MSNEITRFNHVTDWGMERDAHGDYVLHSAHEAEVARLRASVAELIALSENLSEFSSEREWGKFETAVARIKGESA